MNFFKKLNETLAQLDFAIKIKNSFSLEYTDIIFERDDYPVKFRSNSGAFKRNPIAGIRTTGKKQLA